MTIDEIKERVNKQKEALRKGDMKTVKELALPAKPYGDWEKAKEKVDILSFPAMEVGKEVGEASHMDGKIKHITILYQLDLERIDNYEVQGHYSFCKDCKAIWDKYLIAFNNKQNVCYIRELIRHGQTVLSQAQGASPDF